MSKRTTLLVALLLALAAATARNRADTLGTGTFVSFTENLGQWDSRVRFEAQLHNAAVFFEEEGLTVALREPMAHPAPSPAPLRTAHYRMRFFNAAPSQPHGRAPLAGVSNYFIGRDSTRWRTGVQSYAAIGYSDVYPGIGLEFYTANRMMKYNWLVEPGADPSQIAVDYTGPHDLFTDKRGNLHIRTSVADIVEMHPYAYQTYGAGDEVEVEARYEVERLKEGWRVRIRLGSYDTGRRLVIDPVLIFSTYTGSTADNWGTTAAYDSRRNVFTAGLVFGIGYPTTSTTYDSTFNGSCDVGIFMFDSSGSQRLWATYLGGSVVDMPHSMFVNHLDELIIFGTTGSADFPVTEGAYQSTFRGGPAINYEFNSIPFTHGSDLFVARFNVAENRLAASTFVGGSGNDGLNYRNHFNNSTNTVMFGNDSLYYNYGDGARGEIITDNLGNIYVGTTTMSADFPVTSTAVQPRNGGRQDGVVFKLDHNMRNLIWSTYLGGVADDAVYSIDVDAEYNLLVCGGTASANFPVTNGTVQPAFAGGSADGFISKIAYDGSHILASTYYGSSAYDQLYFVRVGRNDEVFAFGQTKASGSTMIHNAGYSVPGSGMLLARFSPDLRQRRWSTVFGTPGRVNLSPTAFAADICNRVYAAGWGRDMVGYGSVQWNTLGTTGMETTADAYSSTTDGQDFYIISLDADANNLEYATFFGEMHDPANGSRGGGDHVDGGTSRFDRLATLYQSVCASCGGFNGFPVTAQAWSDTNRAANCNNAIFRFNVTDDFPVADFIAPSVGCAPFTVGFENTGRGTSFLWQFGDGATSTQRNPVHTYAAPGLYTVRLVAFQSGGCAETDTMERTVQALSNGGYREVPRIACGGGHIQIGRAPQFGASYRWTLGNVSDPAVANPWVTEAGMYVLETSAPGCTQTDTFDVTAYNLLDNFSFSQPRCHDSADGELTLNIGTGINIDSLRVSVSANGAPRAVRRAGQSLVADSLPAGAFVRFAVEGYGCQVADSLWMPNPPVPAYTKQTSAPLCSDSCAGWLHIVIASAASPTTPDLDTLIQALCPATHVTTLRNRQGCPVTDTTVIGLDHSLDSLRAWADESDIFLTTSTWLHATPISGATYRWSPAATLESPHAASTQATPDDTLQTYTVSVTSPNGCTATDSVTIHCSTVTCGPPLFVIPNAFTPNGDGVNDLLGFNGQYVVDFYIAIFSRWGEKVYESSDVNASWDGTYRSQPCLPGVYTYTCRITCEAGIEQSFKGDITLIR